MKKISKLIMTIVAFATFGNSTFPAQNMPKNAGNIVGIKRSVGNYLERVKLYGKCLKDRKCPEDKKRELAANIKKDAVIAIGGLLLLVGGSYGMYKLKSLYQTKPDQENQGGETNGNQNNPKPIDPINEALKKEGLDNLVVVLKSDFNSYVIQVNNAFLNEKDFLQGIKKIVQILKNNKKSGLIYFGISTNPIANYHFRQNKIYFDLNGLSSVKQTDPMSFEDFQTYELPEN